MKQLARSKSGFVLLLMTAWLMLAASPAQAQKLDELSLERWGKLREVERYQLQTAERFYREQNWKVALAEYEKFLTLYEQSEGAPFAQLKWSLCQVRLRKINTAVKDGYQSVIDYWPDSPEATSAAYFIGRSYKDMGETEKAKKAYRTVLSKHPQHLVAVYAAVDLIDIAQVENDRNARVSLWKTLTFDTERTREAAPHCVAASQQLAAHSFAQGAFAEGVKALATTYDDDQIAAQVLNYARGPIQTLTAEAMTKAQGERIADQAIAWVRGRIPGEASPEAKQAAQQLWYLIAGLHAAARRDQQVMETYEQIGRQFGTDDDLLGRLAAWQKSTGRHDEARATYGRFADKVAGHGQIAWSYREQARYDDAATAYRRLLGFDPEEPIKWKAELAITLRHGNKHAEAIAVYEELIGQDSENPGRWRWEIANTHRDAGQFKEAIGVYRQCDNFPANYQQMAWCHRRLKQYNEAILLYNQIIGGDQNHAPWALLQVGYTREEAGQTEQAIKAFQQVCKQFPRDAHASQAHAYLQDKFKITVTLGGDKED